MNAKRALRSSVAAGLMLLVIPLPRFAWADGDQTTEVEKARRSFLRGVSLFDETDYRAALIAFRRAYLIAPNYSVLYNIAQCHYQLLDYAAAMRTYEKYLSEGGAAVPADRRTKVEKELADLRDRVGSITVSTSVVGVEIFVDDLSIGTTPLSEPIIVSVGRRKIVGMKKGYVTSTKMLDVAGGDRIDVPLDLAQTEKTESVQPLLRPEEKPRTSTLTYVGFGVAGAGLVVGSVFGLLALGAKSDVDGQCPAKKCPVSAQPKLDALSRDATISTIGFGVAIVGLGVGVYSLLATPREAPTAGKIQVTPFVGIGLAGVVGVF